VKLLLQSGVNVNLVNQVQYRTTTALKNLIFDGWLHCLCGLQHVILSIFVVPMLICLSFSAEPGGSQRGVHRSPAQPLRGAAAADRRGGQRGAHGPGMSY
jgi:hypothetical protein